MGSWVTWQLIWGVLEYRDLTLPYLSPVHMNSDKPHTFCNHHEMKVVIAAPSFFEL